MTIYVPGTEEKDPKKVIMSLQQIGPRLGTAETDISTLQSTVAGLSYVASIEGQTGALTLDETSGIENSGSAIQLRQASSSQFGAVKVDNTTITAASGVISAVATSFASQAEQETGSSTTKAVSPGRQQYHSSAAKAWANVTQSAGTYTLQSSYNVSSISKTATGRVTVNFTTSFSSAQFAVLITPGEGGSYIGFLNSIATGNVSVGLRNSTSGADLDVGFSVLCFGDQ